MFSLWRTSGTDYSRKVWSVLCLFLAAVILPTACVLWLINNAIGNQRELTRQQLRDVYRDQLRLTRQSVDEYWTKLAADLDKKSYGQLIRSHDYDGALVFTGKGAVAFPAPPAAYKELPNSPEWREAQRLETSTYGPEYREAARAYAAIAKRTGDARAVQAEIRCLRLLGDSDGALERTLEFARTNGGDPLAADLLLAAIQASRANGRRNEAARLLHGILSGPAGTPLGGAQRVFLMKEMQSLSLPPQHTSFPTLQAEVLSLKAAETGVQPSQRGAIAKAKLPETWQITSASGRAVALLSRASVDRHLRQLLQGQQSKVQLVPGGSDQSGETLAAGSEIADWRLAIAADQDGGHRELGQQQMTLYVWIAALVLLAIGALTLFTARLLHRQMKLAGLKSDLVATVSHELKTPIASMRLLLDTLLDQKEPDPRQTREYLELIDRENSRLAQLVESFLTFSRLERNRYAFEFVATDVQEIVERASRAFADRAAEPHVQLSVDVAPGLRKVKADPDAMTTVLLNLLDNAYKYSSEQKRISLRVFESGDGLCFEVQDNGIGVPAGEVKRIFREFYQVDSRLSRTRGGSGLGLSIVRFIVDAHKGSIQVQSKPGEGSTFTISLPFASA